MSETHDIAAIAAGLTKAQRERLLGFDKSGSPRSFAGNEGPLYVLKEWISGDPSKKPCTIARLVREAGRTAATKKRIWGETLWVPTPLGLAVRAHLEGKEP